MLRKFFQALSDLWNRPIYYGGRPTVYVQVPETREQYLQRLQEQADFVKARDRLDLMTLEERLAYRRAALIELLEEQGVLDSRRA